jgi:N-methylhydantoinase A
MLLGVDVGGTFTDAVLVSGDGAVHSAKVPSTPSEESAGVMAAIALVLQAAGAGPRDVERFAHGMTVATNALLQGRTARTALIATSGFTDVIELGRQARVSLYRLCDRAPEPLVERELRFAAPERMGPDGPLRPLDPARARLLVEQVARAAPQAVAVALLHSYVDDAHERMIGDLLAELIPGAVCSLSSELVGTFREYERTATTVVDGALSPPLSAYLTRLTEQSDEMDLAEPQIMQSSGGLTDAARAGAHAALTVLSGPAGGVGGALLLARLAGEPDVLCFDMGGTSCDVCVIDGFQVAETSERVIAGRPLALPALDIQTVGAGGGSIAWLDAGGALRVGPASAGARPGPACYGLGGSEPTVTDANLMLGRLLDDAPLAGGLSLDRGAAQRALTPLADELGMDLPACAEGIVRVAETEMLGALRLMTVERGIDPRGFALMPFGGAGPLHAASMARELGISRILSPRAGGVLCALGLAAAAPRRDVSRTLLLDLDTLAPERLESVRSALVAQAAAALSEGPSRTRVRHELRYVGQSFELPVHEEPSRTTAVLSPAELREAFEAAHEQRYGYRDGAAGVELVNLRVSAWGAGPQMAPLAGPRDTRAGSSRKVVFAGEPLESEVLRGEPAPGEEVQGPALWAHAQSTLLIPPGWRAKVDQHGTVHMTLAASG